MLVVLMLMLLIFGAGAVWYLRRLLKRSLETFGVDTDKKAVKAGLWIGGVLLGAGLLMLPGLEMVALLHFLAVAGVLELLFGRRLARRKWWRWLYGSGALSVALTAAILLGGWWNMHHVVQTDYTLTTGKEIRQEGYTVALIADVHYGVSLDRQALEQVCRRVSAQQPDAVILCGDIVDNSTGKEDVKTVFQTLGTIQSRYGIFYVYGNHDRSMGMIENSVSDEELEDIITGSGITILQDSLYSVTDDFVLAGREDRGYGSGGGRMSVEELLENADPEAFILTLDHQPCEYAENGKAGTDLLLSGHTHGGQIWPANLLVGRVGSNDAAYGLTRIGEDSRAIVTSGLAGWHWSIKTAAPAEYVIIRILPQDGKENGYYGNES